MFGRIKGDLGVVSKINSISPAANMFLNLLFLFLALLCIIPVIFVVIISFTSETSIALNGYSFFPVETTMKAYEYLWQNKRLILNAYVVSITITAAGTALGVLLNATMGYVLSRKTYKLRKFFTYIILVPMLFNGGMISFYLVVVRFLNLKNSLLALILPIAVSSFYVIILRTFFNTTVPDSLIESAKIDGAGQLRIFARIVLPISLPAIATIGLFLAFAYWNEWFNALLFIDNKELVPLQLLLIRIEKNLEFIKENAYLIGVSADDLANRIPSESAKMAIVVLVTVPIACSYPFFQKYFITGLTIGAVKG